MYILSFKRAFGCLNVSLCIYLVFGFSGANCFLTVDAAFFTHDNLANVLQVYFAHTGQLPPLT